MTGARASYSVVNGGPVPIMLGRPTRWRLTEQGWERFASPAFRAISWHLGTGAARQLEFRIPEDAPRGRYRLCKTVRADTDPRPETQWLRGHNIDPLELAIEFNVVPLASQGHGHRCRIDRGGAASPRRAGGV